MIPICVLTSFWKKRTELQQTKHNAVLLLTLHNQLITSKHVNSKRIDSCQIEQMLPLFFWFNSITFMSIKSIEHFVNREMEGEKKQRSQWQRKNINYPTNTRTSNNYEREQRPMEWLAKILLLPPINTINTRWVSYTMPCWPLIMHMRSFQNVSVWFMKYWIISVMRRTARKNTRKYHYQRNLVQSVYAFSLYVQHTRNVRVYFRTAEPIANRISHI